MAPSAPGIESVYMHSFYKPKWRPLTRYYDNRRRDLPRSAAQSMGPMKGTTPPKPVVNFFVSHRRMNSRRDVRPQPWEGEQDKRYVQATLPSPQKEGVYSKARGDNLHDRSGESQETRTQTPKRNAPWVKIRSFYRSKWKLLARVCYDNGQARLTTCCVIDGSHEGHDPTQPRRQLFCPTLSHELTTRCPASALGR